MAMGTAHDPKWKGLLGEMIRAREAVDRADYEDARAALTKLRAQLALQGVRSAHVAWSLAVACDGQGDFEAALEHIREALELDPLALPYQRSYEVIVERLRKTLGDEKRAVDDPTTPSLYALLLRSGEGDVPSHLAMARWRHNAGDLAGARSLLEALTTLAPASRLVWTLLAQVARDMADETRCQEASLEAALLDGSDVQLFGSLPRARG